MVDDRRSAGIIINVINAYAKLSLCRLLSTPCYRGGCEGGFRAYQLLQQLLSVPTMLSSWWDDSDSWCAVVLKLRHWVISGSGLVQGLKEGKSQPRKRSHHLPITTHRHRIACWSETAQVPKYVKETRKHLFTSQRLLQTWTQRCDRAWNKDRELSPM